MKTMKAKYSSNRSVLWSCTAGLTVTTLPLLAAEADNWSVSFSGNVLLNVSAKFTGHPADHLLATSKASGNGAANYDNGYVGTDISGSSTLSTYWGYANAGQLINSGGNVTGLNYQATTVNPGQNSPSADAEPSAGGELLLRRALLPLGRGVLGLQLGASFNQSHIKDTGSYLASGLRTSTTYQMSAPYDAALFPPPGYQGPYDGSGPLLNPTGTVGATTAVPNAVSVSGQRQVDANLFGFKLGPYWEYPVCDKFSVSASAGGLVMVVDDHVNWSETVAINTATTSGYWTGGSAVSAESVGVTGGFYVGMDAAWRLGKDWSLVGGAKWVDAGTYNHNLGAGHMALDFRQAISLNLGLNYHF